MQNNRPWIKKAVLIVSMAVLGGSLGYWWYASKTVQEQPYTIYAYADDERDIQEIEKIFERDLYWLTTRDYYDVRAMLERRTSNFSDPTINNDLFIYIMRDKKTDAFIGFVAFHKLSFYKGLLLFLAINPEFRGKGYAKKLVHFALDKFKQMGVIKVEIFTRLANKPARSLYEGLSFQESSRLGDIGLYYQKYID